MPETDPRILRLLEEALDSDRTPEEVCAEYPELLGEVRERLRHCRSVEAQIEALFPPSGAGPAADGPGLVSTAERIPEIPGYAVEGVLGRGGMGVVYKARQLNLNRTVALKMLLSGAYAAPHERVRFAREAEVVAGLRDAHIVQIYDVGETDGRPYFTMEYLAGGSLAQRLAARASHPGEAAAMVATLARAVQVAHESGVVHRDLKPANVLLTAGGTPKISDFGLARRLAGGATLTRSGARVGTPSYMAPEQALGRAGAAGPLVDVYALGAILYEMLAGAPPFTADTPGEVERKLLGEEPVPPSRINARCPRDLQTICLKCLQKDPQRRYGTPAALADDLDRFLRGEPVAARPARLPERAAKWVRRRPSEAALLVGGTLVAFALLGGGLWLRFERAAVARAVGDDLRDVVHHQEAAQWPDARIALARAKTRMGNRGPAALGRQVRQAEEDLDLVTRLGDVLLDRAAVVEGRFNIRANDARADAAYANAFREAGYGDPREEPRVVADRIAASRVRAALVAALDDWAACAPDGARRAWVLTTARLADRPPRGRRDRLRDPAAWENRAALTDLTRTALQAEPSVQLLVALGEQLQDLGGDAVPFLRQVQQEYPGDFGANFALAEALREQHSPEAIRYFQAAVAVRPRAAAYNNLGITLAANGRADEATEHFRLALRVDRTYAPAHNNLGMALVAGGQLDQAIDHYREALRSDPNDADTHNNLGLALVAKGRTADAIEHYRRAVGIDPDDAPAHNNLGIALRDLGQTDEAIEHFRHALRVRPAYLEAHSNVGIALMIKGRMDDAIEHFRVVEKAKPDDGGNHNNLGLTLAATKRMAEAIGHYRRAIAINPDDGAARNNLGLALRATGELDEAIEQFREAMRINPADRAAPENLAIAVEKKRRLGERGRPGTTP